MDDISDPYIRWCRSENHFDAQDHLPTRAEDLDGEDQDQDPYRVVIFDDLRSLLVDVQSTENRHGMVFLALRLLGLPANDPAALLDTADGVADVASTDIFGLQEAGSKDLPWDAAGGLGLVKSEAVNTPVKRWATNLDTLYATGWFADFEESAVKRLDLRLIRCVPLHAVAMRDADLIQATCSACADLAYSSLLSIASTTRLNLRSR